MGILRLHRILPVEHVAIDPAVGSREELFHLFAELFYASGLVKSTEAVVRRLREREDILSTGIGHGVAVPHAQLEGLGRLAVAASTHPRGLTYSALDGRPVRLAFCLVGDADTTIDHLAGLARLARLARRPEAVDSLVASRSSVEFLATLRQLEEI